jgi:hypothetical protein
MWKSLKDLPTLTELFFGKGVDPATYAPAYLSGKGKVTTKKATIKKAKTEGKSITEVTKTPPKNAKTAEKPRGTRKDYAMQKKKSTANYRAGKI